VVRIVIPSVLLDRLPLGLDEESPYQVGDDGYGDDTTHDTARNRANAW
jgi:hypothetical protein